MASIEVRGLTKFYNGGRPALSDATFRYEGSGAIGYLGPNGAGKTTTLKLLVGLLRPSKGTARLNEHDVFAEPKLARADVGAVIETPEPYPSQTVAEAIEMASEYRGGLNPSLGKEIDQLNELLELPPLDARCGRLSKGQRQRVVIAASLVRDPRVIILDEPTSGLDPKERILIRNLLNELKRDHLILMSSHLMQEVTEICDQVIFVNQGVILLRDSVPNVAARFQTRAVDVEFAAAVAPERFTQLSALVLGFTPLSPQRYRLTFDGSVARRAEILLACQRLGSVIAYAPASLVLEDAYLALMQTNGGAALPAPPPPPPPSS